jgi:hypothetical protein
MSLTHTNHITASFEFFAVGCARPETTGRVWCRTPLLSVIHSWSRTGAPATTRGYTLFHAPEKRDAQLTHREVSEMKALVVVSHTIHSKLTL